MSARPTTRSLLELANAPVSWGVDFPDQPGIPPWQRVLDGIAQSGYKNVELGPYGFLPRKPGELREALTQRGLRAAGGLLYEPFHDPGAHEAIRELASVVIEWIAGAGGSYLLLIPLVTPERDAWAGRAERAPRLDATWRQAMGALFEELAKRAGDAGLATAVHPHAGTHLETRAEVDTLLSDLNEPNLRLCVDTGHCIYGGMDPVALVRDYASLVVGFHLKDLARARLERSLAAGHGFEAAVVDGVFTPLGKGDVDFAALREALLELDVQAWATVEQDIDPRSPGDPIADAVASRSFLVAAGLAQS